MRFYSNPESYFLVLFAVCLVLFVDGLVVSVDFDRGGYASRMRRIIESEQDQNKKIFEMESIRESDLNTYNVN